MRTILAEGCFADVKVRSASATVDAKPHVRLPVVNVPPRFILGYNPNEHHTVFRFAFGRTS